MLGWVSLPPHGWGWNPFSESQETHNELLVLLTVDECCSQNPAPQWIWWRWQYMGVSKNNGIPKSSISIGFSIINHPFWATPNFGNTHMVKMTVYDSMYDYVIFWSCLCRHFPTRNRNTFPSIVGKNVIWGQLSRCAVSLGATCRKTNKQTNKETKRHIPIWDAAKVVQMSLMSPYQTLFVIT